MKESPLVSIITVNYLQNSITNLLLYSLSEVLLSDLEIIVVDNAYDPDSKPEIDNFYPNVKIIRSKENLGFAGGNNLGIKHSNGKYILFLNNDTEVHPCFLEPLIEILQSDPKIGVVSPLIKYWDEPDIIQYAGFSKLNKITQRVHAIGQGEIDRGQYTEAKETNFAHGCAMMIPRYVINEVGIMNEDYFLYYEEHDWIQRIKDRGYLIFFQPKSFVLHKESISTGKGSVLKTYYLNRNRILFMKKHTHSYYKWLAYMYLILISIPYNFFKYSAGGRFNHLKAYINAIWWNVTFNPNKVLR